jgi:hypothetical protein
MLREMKSVQRGIRVIPLRIDGGDVAGGTATTNGVLEGKYHCTITENSSGDYTVTFNTAFSRTPVVLLTSATDVSTIWLKSVSTTAFRVEQVGADQTTPLADADWHALVVGFDADDQN